MKSARKHNQQRNAKARSGVAAAEFAVCLPVVLVIVFGAIEASTMIYLKQSLTVAAYESVRVGIEGGVTNADISAIANDMLTQRNVNGGVITTVPADISTAVAGDYITVRVAAPCNLNSALRGWFFNNGSIFGQATMMKEF